MRLIYVPLYADNVILLNFTILAFGLVHNARRHEIFNKHCIIVLCEFFVGNSSVWCTLDTEISMNSGEYSDKGLRKVVCDSTVVLPSVCVHHDFERAWDLLFVLFRVHLMGEGGNSMSGLGKFISLAWLF